MKKPFSLSIAKPCSEKWEQFTSHSKGAFCHTCQRNVIDFTHMSDQEIISFFKNTTAQSCGRFRANQLKVYAPKTNFTLFSKLQFFRAPILTLFILLVSKQGYPKSLIQKPLTHFVHLEDSSQEDRAGKLGKSIKGIVKDEYNQPLPGVNIYLKGTTIGTTTDANGSFTFPQELEVGEVLIFNYIGFETKEYVITKDVSTIIDIVLITLYMELMGEVTVNTLYIAKPNRMSKWWQQIKAIFP